MSTAKKNTTHSYWPAGWGALVNQQTTHLGMAHNDPTPGHTRVVLVLTWAPRTSSLKNSVETRLIGLGGSYSLHWSQWGHTLQDLQDPRRWMSQPWRTIKSLGLYSQTSQFGYDFVTQAAGRMANSENHLQSFVSDDLVLKRWLPEWIRPQAMPAEDEPGDEGRATILWFTELLQNIERYSWQGYAAVAGLYGVLLLLGLSAGRTNKGRFVVQTVFAVTAGHALLYGFVKGLYQHHVVDAAWGKAVRRGLSYSAPLHYPHVLLSDTLRTTLPREKDVLLHDVLYQSRHWGAYANVVDYSHHGNVHWRETISTSYGNNYQQTLSPVLQKQLRDDLYQSQRQQQSFLMIKTRTADWAILNQDDNEDTDWLVHKEVVKHSSTSQPGIKFGIKWTNYFLSETLFGYWRETVLHQRHVPVMLVRLQQRLSHYEKTQRSTLVRRGTITTAATSSLQSRRILRAPRTTQKKMTSAARRRLLPSLVAPKDVPLPFQVGDQVEGTYDGLFEGMLPVLIRSYYESCFGFNTSLSLVPHTEWYRGTISRACADGYTWDVIYDDGDENKQLCPECIRPFVPYHVGEAIEMRVSPEAFEKAKVVAANYDGSDWTFDIQLESGGDVHRSKEPKSLARVIKRLTFRRGDRVLAHFPGESDMFPGHIDRVNDDGETYAVKYDDGDYIPNVHRREIRILTDEM